MKITKITATKPTSRKETPRRSGHQDSSTSWVPSHTPVAGIISHQKTQESGGDEDPPRRNNLQNTCEDEPKQRKKKSRSKDKEEESTSREEKDQDPVEVWDDPRLDEDIQTMLPSILIESPHHEVQDPTSAMEPFFLRNPVDQIEEVREEETSPVPEQKNLQQSNMKETSKNISLPWLEQSLLKKRSLE